MGDFLLQPHVFLLRRMEFCKRAKLTTDIFNCIRSLYSGYFDGLSFILCDLGISQIVELENVFFLNSNLWIIEFEIDFQKSFEKLFYIVEYKNYFSVKSKVISKFYFGFTLFWILNN